MDGPTETDIAMPTEAERARIQQCMVDHLPKDNKARVLALLPEVLRFKVDLRAAISLFRGDEFVRTCASSGEDFLFAMIQSTDKLHRIQMLHGPAAEGCWRMLRTAPARVGGSSAPH